ncbi:MAG: hypothetical protein ACERIH_04755 [Labilibaculum antarcticum]
MDCIINDTNILIDIYDIGLVEEFFNLNFSFHTTDFVLGELLEANQKMTFNAKIKSGQLLVKKHSPQEVVEIVKYMETKENNVSLTDCSVLLFAIKTAYTLITGDGKLRSTARKEGTDVKGILFLLDQLIEQGIINNTTAHEKLTQLKDCNSRLPKTEVEKRLKLWSI